MFSKLALASLLVFLALIPANAQQQQVRYRQNNQNTQPSPHGLPPCIHGPAVGKPGDAVSQGQFNGNGSNAVASGGGGLRPAGNAQVGLPPCRTSACMGGPGDGIRSDMGRQISGRSVVRQPVYSQQRQSAPIQQTPAMGYGDYTQSR